MAKKKISILDAKNFKKKLVDEEKLFKLEMMGGDNVAKAFRFVDEYGKEVMREEARIQGVAMEKLEKSKRGPKFNYHIRIAEVSIELIRKYSDMPKFFPWGVYPTKEGVMYWMKNLKGETFKKAIKPVGNVHIDMIGGVYTCIRELENTAKREKDALKVTIISDGGKKTPSGIYLPN